MSILLFAHGVIIFTENLENDVKTITIDRQV